MRDDLARSRRLRGVRVLAAIALVAASRPTMAQDAAEEPKLPTFGASDHRLVLTVLDVASRADLVDDLKSKHYFGFEGLLQPAAGVDVVAVSKEFRPLRIYDGDGNEMLPLPTRGRTIREKPVEDYNAVRPGDDDVPTAGIELSKTTLSRVPWMLRSMDAEAVLLIAKTREEHVVPAAVMEDFANIGGVELRIERLTMSPDRKLTVAVQYRRGVAGAGAAFVEAIHALDTDGASLGGGRWTDGTPLKDKAKLTFEFPLDSSQFHQSFKFVICTTYDATPIGFTITGLFDR